MTLKRILLVLAIMVLAILPIVAGTALAARPNVPGGQGLTQAGTTPANQNSTSTPATENSEGTVNSGGFGGGVVQYCTQYCTTAEPGVN